MEGAETTKRFYTFFMILFALSIFVKEFKLKPFYLNQKKFYPLLVCFLIVIFLIVIDIQVTGYADVTPVNERTQQVQDAIVAAVDGVNAAGDVTDTHLAAITTLNLRGKGITELKTGDFEGLSALTDLNLYGNQLSSLPDGIFEGLTALTTLRLGNNTVDPMSITVSLEKVADGQFKAVAPTGAPFAIVLPISAMNGSIAGDATTVTISQGSVESSALTITRTEGTTDAVTVDIGTLPGLPSNHYGYTVSKSDTESLEVIGEVVSTEPDPTPPEIDPTPPEIDPTPPEIDPEPEPPANSAPEFSDGTMAVRAVAENTDAGINISSVVAATDTDSDDTLTYTLSGTDAGSFDIDTTTGQLKTKAALDYETRRVYAVTITVSDGSLTDTITVFINIIDRADTTLVSTSVPVSDRTAAVRDAIVAAISGVSNAADVTATHLAAITALDLRAAGISSLKTGDFSGLTGLTNLNLYGNQMSSLPAGIFEGLTSLTTLRLGGNVVAPMPLIVSLQEVNANQYQAIIPAGAPFDVTLSIDATTVTIPQGSVKSDAFTATGVPVIGALPMLPVNHFGYILAKSAVCSRTSEVAEAIAAAVPSVTDCHNVSEIDLAAITALDLNAKSITSLQADDFAGMLSLTSLDLRNNQLSSLPKGIFAGMTTLTSFQLEGNTVDPIPLTIALLKVGEDQFKAVLSTGAPFAINLSVVVKTGNVASSAMMVTIPQGSVESEVQTITRTAGTFAAVSVDIGTLPSLPAMHSGYALAKVDNLPLEILENINVAPVFTDGSTTTRSIAENTAAGINIGSAVAATDANNDTLTYTLSGDPDASAFDIVSTSGQLQTKAALDYETENSYSVTITVSDSRLTDTIAVTINVTDKSELPPTDDAESVTETNNAPVFTESDSATRSVAENTGSGVDIGSPISATDDDDDTLGYSLGGINAGSFAIDTTTGQLRTRAALNFEAKSSYTVEITVSDNIDTDTITVTINVTDVDEDPVNVVPVFSEGSSATRSIAENTGSGVDIGSPISATDANNDTLSYSLSGTNAAVFSIDSTTGQLRTSAALDFETKDTYTVTITVSDGKGGSATITVTINITNVDEALANNAPVFTEEDSTTRSIAENTGSGVDIGSVVSATDDDNDTLTYTLSGTDASSFSIDSSSGQLRTSAALDYETEDTYSVTISVSDGKGGSATITVTINITNVDEALANNAPVFTEEDSTTRSIAENTGSGVDIGSAVSATDDDNDTLSYSLGGADASSFSIDSSSGQLRTSAALDFETKDTYSVTISVSDSNGGSASINVTISVTNVDETPTNNDPVFTEDSSATRSVTENTGSGVDIGSAVSATDADNDTLTYRLEGADASSFSIDSSSGQLQTSATLDYESKPSYSVIVTVSDENGGSDSITVTISVTNVNESPEFTDGTSTARSIAENAPAGTNIGNAVAATDDDGDTLTYTLGGDPDAASFDIEAETGQLKTKASLDFETDSSYTVTVAVSDSKGGTDSITVTITVTDLDETPSNNPPVFTAGDDPITRSIAENLPAGTGVGNAVAATDADENTLAYLLSGDDASAFSIDSEGQLKTSAPLNHEVKSSYTVTITVSDGSLTDTINVTISVTDVNDAPVFNKELPTTVSIAENAAAANIGDVFTATDEDGDTLTYSIQTLTDVTPFRIDTANGQLQTLRPLDFEEGSSYTVTIAVEDDDGGTDEIEVTISVTDVDENVAPVFTDGDSATTREVAENTGAGVNIGSAVAATDADEDTLEYTLGGDDAAAFDIGSTTGQLRTKSPLDYETENSYSVTITVSDGKGGSDTITVTISVTDVDENVAPVFTDGDSATTREVAENTGAGVNIGNPVAATDADEDTLEYTLGGDDADAFDIGSTTGQLRTKAPLDFETKDSYELTVTVSDDNGGSAEIEVAITITDVDENVAPVFTDEDHTTREVAENTGPGVNIGTPVAATDANNDTLEYTLGGDDADAFEIGSTTGQLRTKSLLDFETNNSYSITITVDDANGGSDEITVTISVTDVDENVAPVFTDDDSTTREVAENTASGVNIGNPVAATDANNDNLTYSLGGEDAASFSINAANGQLRTHAALDYETDDTYSVSIMVRDGNGGSDEIAVTISVADENEAPVFTVGDRTTREVAENTVSGVNIGTAVSATDEDNNTLTYTLGGTDAASFSIVSGTGQLQTSAALDHETKDSYSVTITVSDGSLTDIIAVTINITDVNENRAPIYAQDSTERSIRVRDDTTNFDPVGDPVVAVDPDADTLTYTISGDDASFFNIVSSTGQLRVNTSVISDSKTSYSVTVTASDENGGSDSIVVTITVTRMNHEPMFSDGDSTTRSVAENTASGVNIGDPVSATDEDNDTLTYSLGGTDASSFSIVSTTGQLQTSAALNYEAEDSYSVTITVRDEFGGSDEISVTINITDVNESASNNAPTFGADVVLFIRNIAIVVDTAVGDNIGDPVSATDEDGDTLTYTISGTNASFFSIVSSTGQLQVTTALLNNNKLSYSITITASDNNGGSDSKRVSVRVDRSAQNHAPVFIEGEDTTRKIPEDTTVGENVGSPVTATDADNHTLVYTLGGDDAASFSIVSATGQLQTKAALDYDTDSSYTVTVTATDVYSASDEITVTINITEVDNSLIPVCDRTPQVRDAIVAALSDIDDCNDVTSIHLTRITELIIWHDDTLTSLNSGDFSGLSNLTYINLQNCALTTLPEDIFEGLHQLERLSISTNSLESLPAGVFEGLSKLYSLQLGLQQKVGSNNFYQKTLRSLPSGIFDDLTSLSDLDLGVNALSSLPSGIFSNNTSLQKLDLGGNVLTSLSSDTFDGLSSLRYLYLENNRLTDLPSGIFDDLTSLLDLFLIGNELGSLTSGVFANLSSLKILYLNRCDLRSLPDNIFVGLTSLNKLDLSQNPVSFRITLSLKKVGDGQFKAAVDTGATFDMVIPIIVRNGSISGGATTITVSKGKAESDETLTVTRTAGTAAPVNVQIGNLPSKPPGATDFLEAHSGYHLQKGNIVPLELFGALATNSAPVFSVGESTTRSVVENSDAGTDIGSPVTATDPNNDVLAYTLRGTDAASFSLVRATGQLKTKASLDYENKDTYTVTITTSDGNLTDSISVTINITDDPTDNAPPVFTEGTSTTRTVVETTTAETNIGTPVAATDVDNDTLTYTLGGTDAATFDIDSATGQLKTKAALDFETKDQYTVIVTVSDGNDHTDSITVTINVTYDFKGNDPPVFTDGENTTRSVAENTEAGENIGTPVSATDTENDTLTYTLSGDPDAASFDIVSTTGQLQTKATLDFEHKNEYKVIVTVSDRDDYEVSITVTINIQNLVDTTIVAVCDRTSQVRDAIVDAVDDITDCNDVTTEHLAAITELSISRASVTSLKSGDFSGLPSLETLSISYNSGLTSLPSDIFDGLSSLTSLSLNNNGLTSLPSGVFDDLTVLDSLSINNNSLGDSGLPSGIFANLSSLTELWLTNNSLNNPLDADDPSTANVDFPDNIFVGLTSLDTLRLNGNSGSFGRPWFKVALIKVAEGQFKVRIRVGAPFTMSVPFTVTHGTVDGGHTSAAISVGTAESETFTVTRTAGTTDAVIVMLTSSPSLPRPSHDGYTLYRTDASNQIEVIAAVAGAPHSTEDTVPESTALLANYPNPANPETWIPYQLAKPADVSLTIYNVRGVVVRQLKLGHQQTGIYHTRSRAAYWDGKNAIGESVASGVYFYVFKAGKYTALRKMLIRK